LADDALKGAAPERVVQWHRNRNRGPLSLQLHNPMTAALTHSDKTAAFQNFADIRA
jgi:hypothetical protein